MKSKSMFVKIIVVLMALHLAQDFTISASMFQPSFHLNNVHETYSNLDWNCTSNATCTTEQSYCNDQRKCQCPPAYIFNAQMTACIKVASAYGRDCSETAQCVGRLSVGGNCANGTCSCATGYHYLHGRCKKSFGLGEKCQDNDNCYGNADKEALSCKNGTCTCSDGFYQREYRTCRRAGKVSGAECTIDIDCKFTNAKCDKTTGCYVPGNKTNGETAIQVENDKEKPSLFCTTNENCIGAGAAICQLGYCICEYGYAFSDGMSKCIPELGESCKSNDTIRIENAKCRDGHWSCAGATVTSPNNLICRKVTTKYNTSCQYDEQCYIFGPDAICANKKCVCNEKSHYVENEMFCWVNKKIGEVCAIDEDCYIEEFDGKLNCKKSPLDPSQSVCTCPNGTHVNSAGRTCITDNPTIGSPCASKLDCQPLVNITCDRRKCTCLTYFFDLNGTCATGILGPCKQNDDCKTPNSTCSSKRCVCKDGLVSAMPDKCLHRASIDEECEDDIQCKSLGTNASCLSSEVAEPDDSTTIRPESSRRTCHCNKGHHYKDGMCYLTKVLGETCDSRSECYVDSDLNSVYCLKGVCSCSFDAVRVNATFCKNGATSKYIFSNWFILTVFFAVGYPVMNVR